MSPTDSDEQMMLIDLPKAAGSPAAAGRQARSARSRSKRDGQATAPAALVASAVPSMVLVDPRTIAIDPINARHGLAFDPAAQTELITSMRIAGNTVPVRLRRDPAGGPLLLCPSGSQRLGAALHILHEQPDFQLRAIIADKMTDQEAFVVGEADNAGRTGVAPMLQARKWAAALDAIYGGDRRAFIGATGRSASVVSRTLALAALPDFVLACCSDVDALTPWFAEQLAPKLANPVFEPDIRRRADAMIAAGTRLPGPRLVRTLLRDSTPAAPAPQTVWQSADGSKSVLFVPAAKGGGRVDIADLVGTSTAERRGLVRAFDGLLKNIATIRPN